MIAYCRVIGRTNDSVQVEVILASETLDDETITDVGVEFRSRLKENNDALIIRGAQIQITEQPVFQYNLQEQGMMLEVNSGCTLLSKLFI